MKASEYRKFYLTFVELYGCIHSKDALTIINKFFAVTKKEFYKDLKSREFKMTKRYQVIPTADKHYIICREEFDHDDLNYFFSKQADKPFYLVDDINAYWDIGKELLDLPLEYDDLCGFLIEHYTDISSEGLIALTFMIYNYVRLEAGIEEIINFMNNTGIEFEDIDEANEFLQFLVPAMNKTKLFSNRGYSPFELAEMSGPIDLNNLEIQLGDNIRNHMLDEDENIEEYIKELENDNQIPEKLKQSMIKQLKELLDEKSKMGKA